MANAPDDSRVVDLITQARMALGHNDLQSANAYVQQALQSLGDNAAMNVRPGNKGAGEPKATP